MPKAEFVTNMYYAYVEQSGGCDYTIGCGVRLTRLAATTFVEAQAEALREWKDAILNPEETITRISILTVVSDTQLDIATARARWLVLEKAECDEAQERAEYARLAAKYGKP